MWLFDYIELKLKPKSEKQKKEEAFYRTQRSRQANEDKANYKERDDKYKQSR